MSFNDQHAEPAAAHGDGGCAETTPTRSLTFFNGLAIVVGLQIGSGIFSAPGSVATLVPSPVLGVCVWASAGLLVWTGAASFAELGVRCPDNGGIQEYLRYCFGDLYGFLFAYIWILVIKPCAMSMIAMIFAEYLYKGFTIDHADMSLWVTKGLALMAIGLITYLNCMDTIKAVNTANVFLVLKLATLGTIASFGFMTSFGGRKQPISTRDYLEDRVMVSNNRLLNSTSAPQSSIYGNFSNATEAVLAALFAFGGWESVGFIAGEILDPVDNLPRILNRAMVIVLVLFVLTVTAFYVVLPIEVMQATNAVATAFGAELFGRLGAIFYTWMVCLSCLGALNATVFSAGRLTQAAGARRFVPLSLLQERSSGNQSLPRQDCQKGVLGRLLQLARPPGLSKDHNVPIKAMLLNGLVAGSFVVMGSFRGLLTFKGMTEYTIYLATVCGLLKIRYTSRHSRSDLDRVSYRTPIFNPLIFCGVTIFITIQNALSHWLTALIIGCMFASGTAVYRSLWWQRLVVRGSAGETS